MRADLIAQAKVFELANTARGEAVDADCIGRGKLVLALGKKGSALVGLFVDVNTDALLVPIENQVHRVPLTRFVLPQHVLCVQLHVVKVAQSEERHVRILHCLVGR